MLKKNMSRKFCGLLSLLKKIHNNRILGYIRNTLIYNFAKVFVLVMLSLWFIFTLAPKTAHIYYDNSKSSSLESFTADYIEMDIETNVITVSYKDFASLGLLSVYEIEANGKLYRSDNTSYGISIDITNENHYIRMTPSLNSDSFNTHMNTYCSNGYSLNNRLATTRFSVNCPNGFQLQFEEDVVLDFYGVNAYLIGGDIDPQPIESCVIKAYDGFILRFNQNSSLYTNEVLGEKNFFNANITATKISELHGEMSGDLYFSYTSTPQKYNLKKQKLELQSEKNLNTEFSYNTSEINDLEISGAVQEACVSDRSIFPSFVNWYRDNVYLAPLTLLTTIFGGVALVKKKG